MKLEDLERRISNLEAEIESLKINRAESARRIRTVEKYVDTVTASNFRRAFWWLQGYRWKRLGVWYKARWNRDGHSYED